MGKYLWGKAAVSKAVKESMSYADTLRKLNIPIAGNNTSTLKKKILEYNINISHFTFRENCSKNRCNTKIEDYLNNSVSISTNKLKLKLLQNKLKENKCEICGISTWNNQPLVMQLHHINGNPKDHRLENLQILCPNCHSQTENWGFKKSNNKQKHYCPDCGREISSRSRRCVSCAAKNRQKTSLTKEKLIELLDQGYSRVRIGKEYNVTEATIRKMIKKYNI